jgi:hypothetical protein
MGAATTVYLNGAVYTGAPLADGTYTVTATATDAAGNVSAAATAPLRLVVDTTGAAGSIAVAGATLIGSVATVTSRSLTLTLALSSLSALVELAVSVDGGATYGATTAYASGVAATLPAADGLYTVAVRVVDLAGNVSVFTQSVRLDTAGPSVSAALTPPGLSGSYDLGASVTLTVAATDVSGIASLTARLDGSISLANGSSLDLFSLNAGTHTIVVTAADGVGNVSTQTLTFEVHATVGGLLNAVAYGRAHGLVSSSQQNQLTSILQSAQTALASGDSATAKTRLNSFVTQVQSQSGTGIDAAFAARLVNWTQDLIAHLP